MSVSYRRRVFETMNALIGKTGFQLIRKHSWADPRTYIPHKRTVAEAQKAGLSVGDYIDLTYNVTGLQTKRSAR